jgi:HD superfamily phosphohydrolase
LNQNSEKVRVHRGVPTLSPCESYVIGIGALLHDISHGPYAHDIEKKSHEIYPKGRKIKIKSAYGPYEKHDDYVSNPVLYITLLDHHRSHIARILRRHSAAFWSQLQIEATQYTHLAPFVSAITSSNWDVSDILASILFHLLAFEKIEHAMTLLILVHHLMVDQPLNGD